VGRAFGQLMLATALLVAAGVEARDLPDFTTLAEQNSGVVVNISTSGRSASESLSRRFDVPDIPDDHPLREFLKKFFNDQQSEDEPDDWSEFESESLGSGVVISSDGYILTNYHVISDAAEIIVRLRDRSQMAATIVGVDKRSDIALIKIDATDLPVATIGRSSDLKVGEWVLAIGSPFGFDYTVTAGIISALGRNLPSENYVPFIQTDVAINPGNSGGPLLNMAGEVVGINSQIFSRTGGFMGLSFAIPIDVAMDVAEQLQEKGRVSRGWLGVLIQEVTLDLAESFGMPKPHGALVAQVQSGGPAARAGFKPGDIIVGFDGRKVATSAGLPPMVGRTPVGSRVTVDIIRDGKPVSLTVTIEELPDEEQVAEVAPAPAATEDSRLGVTVTDLTDVQREAVGVEAGGVLVEEVRPGAARSAGIQTGDVILMLDKVQIEDAEHFRSLIAELPSGKKSVAVLVQREDGPIFLPLRLPE
jgi:serine protease Do